MLFGKGLWKIQTFSLLLEALFAAVETSRTVSLLTDFIVLSHATKDPSFSTWKLQFQARSLASVIPLMKVLLTRHYGDDDKTWVKSV